jgi:biotin carboxyl carrier protein
MFMSKKEKFYRTQKIYTPHTGYVTLHVRPFEHVDNGAPLFSIERLGIIDTIESSVEGRIVTLNTSLVGKLNGYHEPVLSIRYSYDPEIEKRQKALEKQLTMINAPYTAAYYLTPSPGEPVLVNEGDKITKDQFIARAMIMKQKRDIYSDNSGLVKKIYFNNGAVIEEGDKLFGIEESKDSDE